MSGITSSNPGPTQSQPDGNSSQPGNILQHAGNSLPQPGPAPSQPIAAPSQPATPPSQPSFLEFLPVSLFGAVMGMCGLSFAWGWAEKAWGFSHWMKDIAAVIALLLFILLSITYLLKCAKYPQLVKAEFDHPVSISFFATIIISLLLLPGLIFPYLPNLAIGIWSVAAVAMFLFAWLVLRKWIDHQQAPGNALPVWVLPIVGTLDVPIFGYRVPVPGIHEACLLFFGVGVIFSIILLVIIINRLLFQPPLPEAIQPTLLALIGPFALALSCYDSLSGAAASGLSSAIPSAVTAAASSPVLTATAAKLSSLSAAASSITSAASSPVAATSAATEAIASLHHLAEAVFYYSDLFLLLLFGSKILNLIRCCPFRVGWWAVGFPLVALTIASFRYTAHATDSFSKAQPAILLTLTTATLLYLLGQSLYKLLTGHLLLPSPAAEKATETLGPVVSGTTPVAAPPLAKP